MKQRQKSSKTTQSPPPLLDKFSSKEESRRDFFARLQVWGLVAAAGGGLTYWIVSDVSASLGEQDLSKIGNGTPAIVQIHDPNCSVCQRLMKETRKALSAFKDGELQYLVANIRQDEGRELASRHNVGHITLLLFDGEGELQDVLSGPNDSAHLKDAFRRHLRKSERSVLSGAG